MSEPLIRNVSDTARWVAAYRERETRRPDALFRDPWAARMAGDRGRAIASHASHHAEWALIARTKLMDDMILQAVAAGTDCVLNLAAGFDTRPYRLPLPPSLRWVEADLPPLIEEKEELLRGEQPRCQLVREAVDLADASAREAFLTRATAHTKDVLVITEGLVMYLEPAAVAELAAALAREARVTRWILDFSAPQIIKGINASMGEALALAPMRFAPDNGIGFFEQHGWRAAQTHSVFRAAGALGRLPNPVMRLLSWLPQPSPRSAHGRWSIVAQLERTAPGARQIQ
jgi:methyltransferase (TIGR00027 family)